MSLTMRRTAGVLLAFAMCMALVPATAMAAFASSQDAAPSAQADIAYSGTSGSCTWSIDMDGKLVVAPTSGDTGTLDDFAVTGVPWNSQARAIKSAVIEPGVKASGSIANMFAFCAFATSIDLSGLDTADATNMANMFYNCSSLKSLSLAGLDTSKVTSMASMFNSCSALETLDLTGIDTSSVTNMGLMFGGCSTLKSIDVSGFDTSNVTTMVSMFYYCPYLESLDLSSFDTSRVNDMTNIFYSCTSLTKVKLGTSFSFLTEGGAPLATLPSGNWYSPLTGRTYTPAYIADYRERVEDTYEKMKDAIDEVVMFRLYNPNSGEHFYTSSTVERDHLVEEGWNYEGEGWSAPSRGEAVYRLYNSFAGEHHYTLSTTERDSLVAAGWNDEGTGWYSTPAKAVSLYRLYNPNEYANNHHYTTSAVERDHLLSLGWKDEGISWYGIG